MDRILTFIVYSNTEKITSSLKKGHLSKIDSSVLLFFFFSSSLMPHSIGIALIHLLDSLLFPEISGVFIS